MRRNRHRSGGFALYEVLIGVTIFAIGVIALGRSVENCMNASSLSTQEDRVRQVLANQMAEIQATPGAPEEKGERKIDTGYGPITVLQQSVPAEMKTEKNLEVSGIHRVTLSANWTRGGIKQERRLEFYVYRAG